MARVERFEDLTAWQQARALSRDVFAATTSGRLPRSPALVNQLQRASLSVMANIAEGFERDGNAEFRHFLSIAKGSSGEVRSHLYAALDGRLLEADRFEAQKAQAEEVSRLIAGLRASINPRPVGNHSPHQPATRHRAETITAAS